MTQTDERRLTLDEYMDVLVARQQEWLAAHPDTDPRYPPLYEWFIRDGDEALVQLPPDSEAKPKPAQPKRPRRYRPAADIRTEIERAEARMATLSRPLSDDPASARLSDARLLRRYYARMDRELQEYTALSERVKRLRWQLTDAENREREADPCRSAT